MTHSNDSNPISRRMEPYVRWLAIFCGYGILFLALGISVEIASRKLFSFSIPGTDDFGGYILAATSAIGAAYTLLIRAHTRIDIFFSRFPPRLRAILNVAAYALFAGFALFMAWRSTYVLGDSLLFQSRSTSSLQTPLWIPQGLWVAGLCLTGLLAALFALHALWLLLSGYVAQVNLMYNPGQENEAAAQQAPGLANAAPKTGKEA